MRIGRSIPPTAAPLKSTDLLRGVVGLFSSGNENTKELERKIKQHFRVNDAWSFCSGTAGLTIILLALKSLSERRRAVIPAYTCFSVPSAIIKAGLEITLCEIDPRTFDFDPHDLEEKVNEKTLCVIPNHLFGIPSNMDLVMRLCRERGVYVVEDAAQAMGGLYKRNKLGTIGDVGFFSLGRGKNITCGSGGIVITNSVEISAGIGRLYSELQRPGFLEMLKEFLQLLVMAVFLRPLLYWFPNGLPFLKLGETLFHKKFPIKRLSEMRAACLWNWPKRLEISNGARNAARDYFRTHIPLNQQPAIQDGVCYLRLPLILDSRLTRDRLYFCAQAKGLGLSRMYPTSIDEIAEIRENFVGQSYPGAKVIAERLLTIPTHPLVSDRDKQAICTLLRSAKFPII
jgi:dTDP-4-amino-4,6-dideoxygalactose transaminase